jgi:hypothetical protein
MVYGVWFVWGVLGDALTCAASLGWLAGQFWRYSEYGCLADGPALCHVVPLEGEECSPF